MRPGATWPESRFPMLALDHLVYRVPDLEAGIEDLEGRLGVRATKGGQHARWGTHNALIALGEASYLELLAPDPSVRPPAGERPLGLDHLAVAGLATWACRASDLESTIGLARSQGVEMGPILEGSRRRSDGSSLTWRLAGFENSRLDGLVPFLIDWGRSPHPAGTAPAGCALLELRAEHPEAARIQGVLGALGLPIRVDSGPEPGLIATIQGPRGPVELR
jgi:hypothetical protein